MLRPGPGGFKGSVKASRHGGLRTGPIGPQAFSEYRGSLELFEVVLGPLGRLLGNGESTCLVVETDAQEDG